MIPRFFLQTDKPPSGAAETTFMHVLHRNLAVGGHPSKEENFCQRFRFPNGLRKKTQAIQSSTMDGTTLSTIKDLS